MITQGASNSSGGSADTGYVRHLSNAANADTFRPDPNPQTVGGKLVSVFTQATDSLNAKTPLANLTGTDFTNSAALKVDVGALASGANAGANIASQQASVAAVDNLDQAQGGFEAKLEETQALVIEAMDQSVQDLGLDQNEAGKSFMPGPVRSDAGATMAVAGGLAGGAALGGVSVIYDLKRMAGDNLSPQDEAKLAEIIQQSFLPVQGIDGKSEASIPNDFDKDMLEKAKPQELVQLFKDILKPASEQPEMKKFNEMRSKLDNTLDVHIENQETNKSTVAIAEEVGVNVADVSIDDGGLTHETFEQVGSGGVNFLEFPPARNDASWDVGLNLVELSPKPLTDPEIAYKPPPMEMTPDGATQAA